MLDTKSFHPWVEGADNILRNVGGVNVFQSNLSVAPSRLNSFKRIPVFHKELIDVWKTFSGGALKDVEFILSQSHWNNTLSLLHLRITHYIVKSFLQRNKIRIRFN